MKMILGIRALVQREITRFLRQRSRVVGALATPLVFWFFIGSGIGESFQTIPGTDYLHYFFPGILMMIILFTAIFSTISIIEDRNEGFLQGVLVSSASRTTIVLGKLLGGTILALGQALLFMFLLLFLDIPMGFSQFLFIFMVMAIIAFGLTGLGFIMAWHLNSTQGFHAIMNLLLMPMWFLSGALFPLVSAPAWLKAVMMANPLTYGMAALHRGFFLGFGADVPIPSAGTCVLAAVLFGIVTFLLSLVSVKKS